MSDRHTRQGKAKYATLDSRGTLVDGRYLVMPIGSAYENGGPAYGSFFYMGPSAFGASGSFADHFEGDVVIVDATNGQVRRVFDRIVRIESWLLCLKSADGTTLDDIPYAVSAPRHSQLIFPNKLVLRAVTEDTNKDGHLDMKDRESVFAFDMKTGERKELCPADANVSQAFRRGKHLLVTAYRSGKEGLWVYDVDTVSGEGRWLTKKPLD